MANKRPRNEKTEVQSTQISLGKHGGSSASMKRERTNQSKVQSTGLHRDERDKKTGSKIKKPKRQESALEKLAVKWGKKKEGKQRVRCIGHSNRVCVSE